MAERKAGAGAKKTAEKERSEKRAANRSTERKAVAAPKQYKNNLDGWICESLGNIKKKNIPLLRGAALQRELQRQPECLPPAKCAERAFPPRACSR
ncbi:hypothetical protein SMICM304S_01703 [Streptomyces microflavus]